LSGVVSRGQERDSRSLRRSRWKVTNVTLLQWLHLF